MVLLLFIYIIALLTHGYIEAKKIRPTVKTDLDLGNVVESKVTGVINGKGDTKDIDVKIKTTDVRKSTIIGTTLSEKKKNEEKGE